MFDKEKNSKKDIGTESGKDVKADTGIKSDTDVKPSKVDKHTKSAKDVKYDKIAKHHKEQYNQAFSQLQRLQADFDNYRKRVSKEKLELGNHAKGQMIMPVLEVIDNLERTIASAEICDDVVALKKGVELTLKQLKDALAKEGLTEIVSLGEKFDPEKHEALLTTESDDHEDDTVFEELQKGYIFKEKVIRPTKVKVVKNN